MKMLKRSKKSKKSSKSKKSNNPYLNLFHGKNKKAKKLRDYFKREYENSYGKLVGKQILEQNSYIIKQMANEWNKLKE